jgi:hypothetical protein
VFGRVGTAAQSDARLPGKIVAAVETESPAIKRRRLIQSRRVCQTESCVFEGESSIFLWGDTLLLPDFKEFSRALATKTRGSGAGLCRGKILLLYSSTIAPSKSDLAA